MYDHSKIPLAEFRQRSKDAVSVAYPSGSVEENNGVTASNTAGGELQNGYTDHLGNRLISVNNQLPEETQRNLLHAYYAAVSFTDAQVGKLLDELKKQGLDKNTIIVLWGDHGWHLGDHLLWAKHTNFEQATRAPLMIYSPAFKGNQKATGLTEFVDIFPTLCELSGLKTPANLAGTSLVNLMKNPTAKGRPYAISQYPRQKDQVMGYAIRTEKYRYVAWLEKDFRKDALTMNFKQVATELYDMQNDPHETVNLAKNPQYKADIDGLDRVLRDFLKNEKPYQETK